MSLNNPAGRLLYLLQEGKSINQGNVKNALAVLLKVEGKSESEIFSRISYLLVVPFQIRGLVEKIEIPDPELLLPSVNRIESFFSNLNLKSEWRTFRNQFDSSIIQDLKISDSVLSKKFAEPDLRESKKDEYLKKLDELYNELLSSDINEPTKGFLLLQIEQLIVALETYFFTGSKPIIDKINSTVGTIVLSPRKISGVDTKSVIWKRFLTLLFGLFALVGGANDIKELPKNYPNLLPAIEDIIEGIVDFGDDLIDESKN
jgi:hypothetical protein